jgi:hypothetical protein
MMELMKMGEGERARASKEIVGKMRDALEKNCSETFAAAVDDPRMETCIREDEDIKETVQKLCKTAITKWGHI